MQPRVKLGRGRTSPQGEQKGSTYATVSTSQPTVVRRFMVKLGLRRLPQLRLSASAPGASADADSA